LSNAEFTQAQAGAEGAGRTSRPEASRETPGAEIAEEAGLALRLHELLKARDTAMPEVMAEWEVVFEGDTDIATQEEGRLAHESIRSRIDALSRIDPSELPEGSIPPTSMARETAISVIEALFHGRGILFQHVTPLPDAGIELEYESPNLYLGLWIHDRDNIDLLVRRGSVETSQKMRIDQLSDVVWERLG
jgi:hypothetical protein